MENINAKLVQTLKQKNVNLNLKNLNHLAKSNAFRHRTPEKSSKRDVSPADSNNASILGSTSSNFRVRSINQTNPPETSLMRASFRKTSNKLPPRPGSAYKNEPVLKTAPSQLSIPLARTLGAISGRSNNSQRGQNKSESTRLSDNDVENDINFVNIDDDFGLDDQVREELEIFNDIADLNEEKLADILGVDTEKLDKMMKVEMRVDLSFNSLQPAGEILVNLKQLKLNNSIINSLRDIGNSFRNLEILWISKCGLKDLAGLSAFPRLQELYAPYNNIKDLSDVMIHENLQVLDLEANEIKNLDTIEHLNSLYNMTTLTLASNPIAKTKNYEQKVMEMLPQLEYLNDKSKQEVGSQKASEFTISDPDSGDTEDDEKMKELYSKFEKFHVFSVKDFQANTRQAILDEMIKEPSEEDIIMMSVKKSSRKAKATVQENDDLGHFSIKASTKKGLQRPQSSRRPQSANKSLASKARGGAGVSKAGSIFADTERLRGFGDGFSDLVHQTDQAFAGNPLKALRHKRKNQFTSGFENVEGENIAKPKDIMKLIEEFEIPDDESEEDEAKKFEEMLGPSNSASEQQQQSESDQDTKVSSKTSLPDEKTDFDTTERANLLMQRGLRPGAKIRVASQEKKEPIDLHNNFKYKEISIQDIRNQLNGKTRFKIQVKARRPPASMMTKTLPDQA